MNAIDVVNFARQLIGRPYVLGAVVTKDNPDFKSLNFDCAEFVAYSYYQALKILYGCDTDDPAKAHIADAYTGYFKRDAIAKGIIISVAEAAQTPGAIGLRYPAPGANGHVVLSQGKSKTIEGMSSKYGCVESTFNNRRFDIGILVPGVNYDQPDLSVASKAPAIVYRFKDKLMVDPYIGKIQQALGFTGRAVDNTFGIRTLDAVIAFQRFNGLIIDGEVMPGGQTARALGII